MNPSFSFSSAYPNLLSIINRRHWKADAFEAVYKSLPKEALFFAQTFYDFASFALRNKDDEMLIPHRMYLGAILMLQLVGYSFEAEASIEESIIRKLQAQEKTLV